LEDFPEKNLVKSATTDIGQFTAAHWISAWQKRRVMHHLAACGARSNPIGIFYARRSIDAFNAVAIAGAAQHNLSLAESY
jgi:hypothetical protein